MPTALPLSGGALSARSLFTIAFVRCLVLIFVLANRYRGSWFPAIAGRFVNDCSDNPVPGKRLVTVPKLPSSRATSCFRMACRIFALPDSIAKSPKSFIRWSLMGLFPKHLVSISMGADCKHRYAAAPHDVLRKAAQQQMHQSRATVGSHDDHLAIQVQRGIHIKWLGEPS